MTLLLFCFQNRIVWQDSDLENNGMVCVSQEDRVEETEDRVQCIVHSIKDNLPHQKFEKTFPASTPVKELIAAVANSFTLEQGNVQLEYQHASGASLIFTERTVGTLGTIGLNTSYGARNSMSLVSPSSKSKGVVRRRRADCSRKRDDYEATWDSSGGEAAVSSSGDPHSPVIPEPPPPPPGSESEPLEYGKSQNSASNSRFPSVSCKKASNHLERFCSDESSDCNSHEIGFVGLVNQAMTCYLNSLLQALFMTPEFRNALYKWKFDPLQNTLPQKCIPYQLQKLFLNLQMSNKSAVETTELTKSFGWESGEVWQQHDIQELCRVMFDALEGEFKNTEQNDLINILYQGKMIDYVKCLECGTEKSKEDVFLDIPLPVRPFGSTIAYKDIDEALRAFVRPETLDGNNQYFCETCNKKCDAHKGLKFSKFPYLLTLHLKRFDFDYRSMHRIKLNDKVTFPRVLDLNSFVLNSETSLEDSAEVIKNDDSSTTDSALDDETNNHQCNEAPPSIETDQDDDEGVDLSNNSANCVENEKNINQLLSRGPYVYELYSIMIHSGSASGGHYYAYIKDFTRGEWYCFNDQSVTPITSEDIVKTYGGGPYRSNFSYTSMAHSSSTNAYMLMYRQIDKEKNCYAMTTKEFPPHIQKIMEEILENEERERQLKLKEEEMISVKVFYNEPGAYQNHKYQTMLFDKGQTLNEALSFAYYSQIKWDLFVPIEQCRFVLYDRTKEHCLEMSLEEKEKMTIKELLAQIPQFARNKELFLETRDKNSKFFPYNIGDDHMIVHVVDLDNSEIVNVTNVRTAPCQTLEELKEFLKKAVPLLNNTDDIHLALVTQHKIKYLTDPSILHSGSWAKIETDHRIFVTPVGPDDGDVAANFENSKFYKCVSELKDVVIFTLVVPKNLEEHCDTWLIPLLDDINESAKDGGEMMATELIEGNQRLNNVDEEFAYSGASGMSDQSASEDSSLTDSERTIIGDTEVGTIDGRVSSGSDSDHLLSPGQTPSVDDDVASKSKKMPDVVFWSPDTGSQPPSASTSTNNQPLPKDFYFRAEFVTDSGVASSSSSKQKVLNVAVDRTIEMATLKSKLEKYTGVAGKYMKLVHVPEQKTEISLFYDTKNNDRILIALQRLLEPGEFKAKLYHLDTVNLKNLIQQTPVELILPKNGTVGESKKDIAKALAKKGWKVPYDRLRLRTKQYKQPGPVLLDSTVWEKRVDSSNFPIELFFQELDGPEKVTANTFMAMFVRRWYPSTITLGPFGEVVLEHHNEFLKKLSELSEIPVEHVQFAKGASPFPSELNVISVMDLDWTNEEDILVEWKKKPYEHALVIFYRDGREKQKNLTKQEAEEISQIESLSMSSSNYSSSYYSRRENALKIYREDKPSNKIGLD